MLSDQNTNAANPHRAASIIQIRNTAHNTARTDIYEIVRPPHVTTPAQHACRHQRRGTSSIARRESHGCTQYDTSTHAPDMGHGPSRPGRSSGSGGYKTTIPQKQWRAELIPTLRTVLVLTESTPARHVPTQWSHLPSHGRSPMQLTVVGGSSWGLTCRSVSPAASRRAAASAACSRRTG